MLEEADAALADAAVFNATFNACHKILAHAQPQQRTALLEAMDRVIKVMREQHTPDECTYACLIKCYGVAGCAEDGIRILETMKVQGLQCKRRCYQPLLEACASAGMVEEAFSLFDDMVFYSALPPTVSDYIALSAMCSAAGLCNLGALLLLALPLSPPEQQTLGLDDCRRIVDSTTPQPAGSGMRLSESQSDGRGSHNCAPRGCLTAPHQAAGVPRAPRMVPSERTQLEQCILTVAAHSEEAAPPAAASAPGAEASGATGSGSGSGGSGSSGGAAMVQHLLDLKQWLQRRATATAGTMQTKGVVFIDGPNVAYYRQNTSSGRFRPTQIEGMRQQLLASGTAAIIVLPDRYLGRDVPNHTRKKPRLMEEVLRDDTGAGGGAAPGGSGGGADGKGAGGACAGDEVEVWDTLPDSEWDLIRQWERSHSLWRTPDAFSDDWAWLFGSAVTGFPVVTNDAMRDHLCGLTGVCQMDDGAEGADLVRPPAARSGSLNSGLRKEAATASVRLLFERWCSTSVWRYDSDMMPSEHCKFAFSQAGSSRQISVMALPTEITMCIPVSTEARSGMCWPEPAPTSANVVASKTDGPLLPQQPEGSWVLWGHTLSGCS
jgi:pentatricopeptide repeat protein